MTTDLRIDTFGRGDPRVAEWHTVRARLGYPTEDTVVPGYQHVLASSGDTPLACLAMGTAEDMTGAPGRSGLIGWYEAAEAEAGVALLRHARETLRSAGAVRVLGPINGSTWGRYRLALPNASGDPPLPFLTEPRNPPEYPEHFRASGFAPIAEYESRIVSNPRPDSAARRSAADRLRGLGVEIRSLDLESYDLEIRAIFELSLAAFAGNAFYTPVSFAEFRARYERVRPLLDATLVRLARDAGGELLGFVFAFSDPLADADRPRIVLKTLATAPGARGLGLGTFLTNEIDHAAAERGTAVIHALMQTSNASMRISSHSRSEIFRRYALYCG